MRCHNAGYGRRYAGGITRFGIVAACGMCSGREKIFRPEVIPGYARQTGSTPRRSEEPGLVSLREGREHHSRWAEDGGVHQGSSDRAHLSAEAGHEVARSAEVVGTHTSGVKN